MRHAKLHRDANLNCATERTLRKCFPVRHLSNHAAKSPYECLNWPLNCDFWGAELLDLLTTSAYIPHAAYVQKHRKRELRACLIGRVPRHDPRIFFRSGMLNCKLGLSCVHCVIQISQLILLCVHCVIQIAHFALVWKQSSTGLTLIPLGGGGALWAIP